MASGAILVAHLAGAVFTFTYLSFIAPSEPAPQGSSSTTDILVFLGFIAVAFPVTGWWCERIASRALAWIIEERPATEEERALTLNMSRRIALVTFVPWLSAAIFFGLVNVVSGHTFRRMLTVALTTIDGGLISCTIGFLLVEKVMHPAIAAVLDGSSPPQGPFAGVRLRLFTTWLLGSAVPLAGLFLLPLASQGAVTHTDLGPAI